MAYEKMDPVLKEKWIEALRSGNYVQAKNTLYSPILSVGDKLAMCCLGVLEHICGTELADLVNKEYPDGLDSPKSSKDFRSGLYISAYNHTVGGILAMMNDGSDTRGMKQHSFEEIAQWIEKNL